MEKKPLDTNFHPAGKKLIDEFSLESKPGNERHAIARIINAIKGIKFPEEKLDRIRTAVGEATMNAMEHGNHYQPDLPVEISVYTTNNAVSILITDHSGDQPIPVHIKPDLEAKLAGLQSPRGWGLFLIENMVDEVHVYRDIEHHTLELIFRIEENL